MADTQKLVTPAERKKRWLKKLAAERASAWCFSVLHPLLDGKTRVETTREVLELEDGVCVAWYPKTPRAGAGTLVGTRVVGWVTSTGKLVGEPVENGRMLMWRGGSSGTTTVALLAPMRQLEPIVPLTIFNETMPIEVPPVSATMRSADDSWSDADIEATRHEGGNKRRAG